MPARSGIVNRHIATGAAMLDGAATRELLAAASGELAVQVSGRPEGGLIVTLHDRSRSRVVERPLRIRPIEEIPEAVTIGLGAGDDRGPASLVVTGEPTPSGEVSVVGQLICGAPAPPGADVLCTTNEIEPGVRAMLLHLPGRLRLDAIIDGDSLSTFVRNLSAFTVQMRGDPVGPGSSIDGAAADLSPARAALELNLGEGAGGTVRMLIATVRAPARGGVRVSAQAVVSLPRARA